MQEDSPRHYQSDPENKDNKRPQSHRKQVSAVRYTQGFQIISDFKANFIFHVKNKNTKPSSLSAHAVN